MHLTAVELLFTLFDKIYIVTDFFYNSLLRYIYVKRSELGMYYMHISKLNNMIYYTVEQCKN